MPDSEPSPSPEASTVLAVGWEFHLLDVSANSDKFYRVILSGSRVLIVFGRAGTRGKVKVHEEASLDAAKAKARSLTRDKARKGYGMSVDVTEFRVPVDAWQNAKDDQESAAAVLSAFEAAATRLPL